MEDPKPFDQNTAALVAAQLTHAMAAAGCVPTSDPAAARTFLLKEFAAVYDELATGNFGRIPR